MTTFVELKKEIELKADIKKAKILAKFFKTGHGEYGEGDLFLGITVPETRKMVKKYNNLKNKDVLRLLASKFHEERLLALLIMVDKFQEEKNREEIYNLYLENTRYINNWDLVDLSAYKIVGVHLIDKPKEILYKLARSKSLWERRISIISTFYFIKNNKFEETIKLAEILLKDDHDLIHKAVGWMLREVGKRDVKKEKIFLDKYYKIMPRTMLRYAIEKFPEKERKYYLKNKDYS